MNYFNDYGQNIKLVRKQLLMTREELSAKAHISVTTLSHVEQCFHNCTLKVLFQIADALKIDAVKLLFNYQDTQRLLGLKNRPCHINPLEVGGVELILKSNFGIHAIPVAKGKRNEINFLMYLIANDYCADDVKKMIKNSEYLIDYAVDSLR